LPDPASPGKFICRCYGAQAINCGKYPDVPHLVGADNLSTIAARCPGVTVHDPEALKLLPGKIADRKRWFKEKPWLGTRGTRIKRWFKRLLKRGGK
jgi:hypothetical protein